MNRRLLVTCLGSILLIAAAAAAAFVPLLGHTEPEDARVYPARVIESPVVFANTQQEYWQPIEVHPADSRVHSRPSDNHWPPSTTHYTSTDTHLETSEMHLLDTTVCDPDPCPEPLPEA